MHKLALWGNILRSNVNMQLNKAMSLEASTCNSTKQ
jgi:hypothetical protein